MATAGVSSALKQALFDTLNSILSPHQQARANAEAELKVLEVTDEYGVHLAELTLDPAGYLPIRQLASVLLKQYVECHWVPISEKFREPEVTPEAKAIIRSLLPSGLREPISKVRSSVAYAISAIAQWDWPEQWPELFDFLVLCISGEEEGAVHGAMRVLAEFSREVSDRQMPQVAAVILPQMYRIYVEPEKYSVRTRSLALEIFATCVQMILITGIYDKGLVKALVLPVLPQFTAVLVKGLESSTHTDSGLKKEELILLTIFVKHLPKHMTDYMDNILNPVWTVLTSSADLFLKTIVNDNDDVDNGISDDEPVLDNLIFSLFEFVTVVVEAPRFKTKVKQAMQDLIYYVILFMQITEEQISMWSTNPSKFVEHEGDYSYSFSVRLSAQDLLSTLSDEFGPDYIAGLLAAITRHIHEAEEEKNAGSTSWWKRKEACFLALACSKRTVLRYLSSNLNNELNLFFQNVVLPDLNLPDPPMFLVGRCLIVASKFAKVLSPEISQRFLQGTVAGLQQLQAPCIRCSAAKAISWFCQALKGHHQTMLLAPFLGQMMDGLLSMAAQFNQDVLALILDSITVCLTMDPDFSASQESKVTPLALNVLMKHNGDPLLVLIVQSLLTKLTQCHSCQEQFHQRVIPVLLSIIQHHPQQVPMGLQAVVLEVLETIVRKSRVPLCQDLISQVFPACVALILFADDVSVLQNGGECVRAYVSVAYDQLANWHDENGENGIMYSVKVALHLLDRKHSESSATFVGRLISQLFKGSGGSLLGNSTDALLRGVLSKMQQTDTPTVLQSLVLVFAQLLHSQLDSVLEFLSSVPGPSGNSALEYVLRRWLDNQHIFYGAYVTKICLLALCKLLEYSIQTNDRRMMELTVEVVDPGCGAMMPGVRTRSKAEPTRTVTIPLIVEIYKVLLLELSNVLEAHMASVGAEDSFSDEEEEDDWATQDSNMSVPDSYGDTGSDSDSEDQDEANDPLYQVNVETFLNQFLRTLTQHPCYGEFSRLHTAEEKVVLSNAGILSL